MVIYKSFYEAIKGLPDDIRLALHDAIMEYGLYGIEPEKLDPVARCVFVLIKPQIDANNRKYENGKKGGRPRKAEANQDASDKEPTDSQKVTDKKPNKNQTETKTKPNNNQEETKAEPNVNVNVNANDNVSKEKSKSSSLDLPKKKSKEEETIERRRVFYQSLIPFVEVYGKEMIRNFYDYWSEMNKSKTRMRWEGEKTWELQRRLEYWSRRDNDYKAKSNGTINQASNAERKEQERVERATDAYSRIMRLRAQDAADGSAEVRDD